MTEIQSKSGGYACWRGTHKLETYTVSYQTGGSTGRNHNIRNDTVKNSRPGIKFCKTGWDGVTPLAGTGFTLKKANDGDDAGSSLISDNSGLITIAYLDEGTYTLTEVETPRICRITGSDYCKHSC